MKINQSASNIWPILYSLTVLDSSFFYCRATTLASPFFCHFPLSLCQFGIGLFSGCMWSPHGTTWRTRPLPCNYWKTVKRLSQHWLRRKDNNNHITMLKNNTGVTLTRRKWRFAWIKYYEYRHFFTGRVKLTVKYKISCSNRKGQKRSGKLTSFVSIISHSLLSQICWGDKHQQRATLIPRVRPLIAIPWWKTVLHQNVINFCMHWLGILTV